MANGAIQGVRSIAHAQDGTIAEASVPARESLLELARRLISRAVTIAASCLFVGIITQTVISPLVFGVLAFAMPARCLYGGVKFIVRCLKNLILRTAQSAIGKVAMASITTSVLIIAGSIFLSPVQLLAITFVYSLISGICFLRKICALQKTLEGVQNEVKKADDKRKDIEEANRKLQESEARSKLALEAANGIIENQAKEIKTIGEQLTAANKANEGAKEALKREQELRQLEHKRLTLELSMSEGQLDVERKELEAQKKENEKQQELLKDLQERFDELTRQNEALTNQVSAIVSGCKTSVEALRGVVEEQEEAVRILIESMGRMQGVVGKAVEEVTSYANEKIEAVRGQLQVIIGLICALTPDGVASGSSETGGEQVSVVGIQTAMAGIVEELGAFSTELARKIGGIGEASKKEKEEADKKLAEIEKEQALSLEKLKMAEEGIAEAEKEIEALKEKQKAIEEERERRAEESKKEKEKHDEETERLRADAERSSEEFERLTAEIKEKEEKLAQDIKEKGTTEENLEDLTAKLKAAEATNGKLSTDNVRLDGIIRGLQEESKSKITIIEEQEENIGRLKNDLKSAQAQLVEAKQRAEDLQGHAAGGGGIGSNIGKVVVGAGLVTIGFLARALLGS
jgi:chromosome segregation ATPase